mmetsp:Transcript_7341/g.17255  ORF Transcript_7341/g.17255 Transcript_7341/m.17255 type:complete len:288 (+) Transcript_7341:593-1456(+)
MTSTSGCGSAWCRSSRAQRAATASASRLGSTRASGASGASRTAGSSPTSAPSSSASPTHAQTPRSWPTPSTLASSPPSLGTPSACPHPSSQSEPLLSICLNLPPSSQSAPLLSICPPLLSCPPPSCPPPALLLPHSSILLPALLPLLPRHDAPMRRLVRRHAGGVSAGREHARACRRPERPPHRPRRHPERHPLPRKPRVRVGVHGAVAGPGDPCGPFLCPRPPQVRRVRVRILHGEPGMDSRRPHPVLPDNGGSSRRADKQLLPDSLQPSRQRAVVRRGGRNLVRG